jgi:RNA polymerase sigma factor (sigma-70 family)
MRFRPLLSGHRLTQLPSIAPGAKSQMITDACMTDDESTRQSLILRLQNGGDEAAWQEFAAIYQPLIYRLIRRHGVQDADAQELTQQAMVAVASAIQRQGYSFTGSFRAWLRRIARNMMVNYLTRVHPGQRGVGGSDFHKLLQSQPSPDQQQSALFELERQREVFRWAAEQVKATIHPTTWQAFWQTSIEGCSVAEAARTLGISVGSVYAARSRTMAKLKQAVDEWEADQIEPEGAES